MKYSIVPGCAEVLFEEEPKQEYTQATQPTQATRIVRTQDIHMEEKREEPDVAVKPKLAVRGAMC